VSEVLPRSYAAPEPRRRVREVLLTYLALTKPRVIELLLVTTVPAMILADEGMPKLWLILAVLAGGALGAGGANTINCWIERDRDQVMRRTQNRPLATGAIEPNAAIVFGIVLEVLAFALLWATANLLSACLVLAATLFYVFVYTIWLKPRSPQNIVIGGAAGAVPALVGWAAVTGSLAAPAWVMFALVFVWTPPHFWALAMRYLDDYAAAGIPMMPVVKGPHDHGRSGVPRLRHRARRHVHLGCLAADAQPGPDARDPVLRVLEPVPRVAVRGHCRRHPRPQPLSPDAACWPRSWSAWSPSWRRSWSWSL